MSYPYRYFMTLMLLITLGLGITSAGHAQSAQSFHTDDLGVLPHFYDLKVNYIKNIMQIQDVALSLISVSDTDIFDAYCKERLKADAKQSKQLKQYAEQQKSAMDHHHALIRNNENILISAVLKRLHKESGLVATSLEDMTAALDPEIKAYRKRAKEIMRRMLMHDMVWGPTQCKAALKSGAKEAPKTETDATQKNQFIETSLYHYISLLAHDDQKAKDMADQLLQKPQQAPQNPNSKAQAEAEPKEKTE